jgi:hypothetical protein
MRGNARDAILTNFRNVHGVVISGEFLDWGMSLPGEGRGFRGGAGDCSEASPVFLT